MKYFYNENLFRNDDIYAAFVLHNLSIAVGVLYMSKCLLKYILSTALLMNNYGDACLCYSHHESGFDLQADTLKRS